MNAHATAQEIEIADSGHTQVTAPVAPRQSNDMLSVIERIATSPHFNIDALNAVVALRERIQAAEAKSAFDRDLAAMQPQLPTIDSKGKIVVYSKADREKNGGPRPEDKPQQETPYALMADINDAIRPAMSEHGFALSFRAGEENGKIKVTGILSHRDGHREETSLVLQHDSTGSKNPVQAVGSSLQYGRRYATLMLLNISSRAPQDMDDDGKAGGSQPTIEPEAADYVRKLISETNSNEALFLEALRKTTKSATPLTVDTLTTDTYKEAIRLLNNKRAKEIAK